MTLSDLGFIDINKTCLIEQGISASQANVALFWMIFIWENYADYRYKMHIANFFESFVIGDVKIPEVHWFFTETW